MYTIFLGISSAILDSFALGNYKKALNQSNISKGLFKLFAKTLGILFVPVFIFIFGFDLILLQNNIDLFIVFIVTFIKIINSYIHLHVIRKTKLSEVLPYENLDKLFTIIIGFFIFYGTVNSSSIITFTITIFTLLIVFFFTIDLKNLKIPNTVGLYTLNRLITSISILLTGYLLVKYSSVTMMSIMWGYETILFLTLSIVLGDSFGDLFKQSKGFYINRFTCSTFGWTSWIISLFILKEVGVVIMSLLGFFTVVSSILSMKILLDDTPNKKQIILSIFIILLIGVGYYFK